MIAARRAQSAAVAVAAAAVILAAAAVEPHGGDDQPRSGVSPPTDAALNASIAQPHRLAALPGGGQTIFKDDRILVAYYGTANTGSLGVLGEARPDEITKRLRRAARPFARGDRTVQIVYELIASVAQASPGPDGDYSNYIARSDVRRYVRAAKRNRALLVLDLQPGRSSFLPQARHFGWALRRPWVGLALDPEWHMGPRQIPAQVVGHVGAVEVNAVSRYVARIVRNRDLPQKLFMIHQFRTDMVRHIENVKLRPGLAMVQHIDGFGSRRQKLATYHAVAKPRRFTMGFKLFYDEDSNLFSPARVLRIHPRVQFVSYQ